MTRLLQPGLGAPPSIALTPNPDILATLSRPGPERPALVIGFAAETDDLMANAAAKHARKGRDWIVANDVSPATGIMGGDENTVHLITAAGMEDWPRLHKDEVARRLATRIPNQRHEGRIFAVYVQPLHRKHHHASHLIAAAIAHAGAARLVLITLSVTVGNDAARRLYAGHGFTSAGVVRRSMKVGDKYYDEETMQLDLD